MQSTGHSFTHERWTQSMHVSVMTYVMTRRPALGLQDCVNGRHGVIHLAGPLRFGAGFVKAEHGSLGEHRAHDFRRLDPTYVSTHAVSRPVPEREMSAFLRAFGIEL